MIPLIVYSLLVGLVLGTVARAAVLSVVMLPLAIVLVFGQALPNDWGLSFSVLALVLSLAVLQFGYLAGAFALHGRRRVAGKVVASSRTPTVKA